MAALRQTKLRAGLFWE